ncbi:Transporter, CPA2 family (fragment) [Hyella patelloides LEGE 07179]|uniref:Transporter, CPA2 family n=1 Tax=Hyella patelloides LEGE 07179 TaxID=945734 RepID=A0A563VJ25_9CYAN
MPGVSPPNNEDNLLSLALILAKTANGTLLPLNVLSDRDRTVSPEARIQQQQLLAKAETIAHSANAKVKTIGRVDDEIDRGIVRTALEQDASLVVCGWRGYSTYQDSFFGSTIDNVALQLPIPVLIARFVQPIANTARVFLAVTKRQALSEEFEQTLRIAKMLANELKTSLEVLVVVSKKQTQLSPQELAQISRDLPIGQAQGNTIKEVSQKVYKNDLLLLPVKTAEARIRNRSAVGTLPEAIARSHENISVVVIHFPLSS